MPNTPSHKAIHEHLIRSSTASLEALFGMGNRLEIVSAGVSNTPGEFLHQLHTATRTMRYTDNDVVMYRMLCEVTVALIYADTERGPGDLYHPQTLAVVRTYMGCTDYVNALDGVFGRDVASMVRRRVLGKDFADALDLLRVSPRDKAALVVQSQMVNLLTEVLVIVQVICPKEYEAARKLADNPPNVGNGPKT